MDFRLYAQVLWRFRLLVALGLVVAFALAELSVVRVSTSGAVRYREAELWSTTTQLKVTGKGFPEGRLGGSSDTTQGAVADPGRLNDLAFLYAQYATIDPVRRLMLRGGPTHGKIIADPVIVGDVRVILPLINLTAISTSPKAAITLAERGAKALETYIREEQRANNVPALDRVVIQQIHQPTSPVVYQSRSKTLPIVVFLVVMFAFTGLAFILENARPRRREQDEPDGMRKAPAPAGVESQPQATPQRRTA